MPGLIPTKSTRTLAPMRSRSSGSTVTSSAVYIIQTRSPLPCTGPLSEMLLTRAHLLLLITSVVLPSVALQAQTSTAPDVLVSRQLAESEHIRVGQMIVLSPHANGAEARPF